MTSAETAPKPPIVRRKVFVDIDLDGGSLVLPPWDLGMEDDESIAEFIARQIKERQTPYSLAKDLDLIGGGVRLTFSVMETGADGKSRCVDQGEWSSHD